MKAPPRINNAESKADVSKELYSLERLRLPSKIKLVGAEV